MLALRRRHRALAAEDGFSLVELLVIIVVLGVIGAFLTAALVNGLRATEQAQNRVAALTDLQKGIERVSRELRAADPLRQAQPNFVAMDIRRSGNLTYFEFELTGGELVERRRIFTDPAVYDDEDFDPTTETPDSTFEGVLVSDVDNASTGVSLVTYRDRAGNATNDPAEVIEATLVVIRTIDADSPPLRVETTVTIRNTERDT